MRKVMVFGAFDGIHPGHRALFKQAKKLGDRLVVAIAQDEVVLKLKGRLPKDALSVRMARVQEEEFVDEAVAGDSEMGTYGVVKEHRPAIIVLGYDQKKLEEDLRKNLKKFDWPVAIVIAGPHRPHRYHSSLLRKVKKSPRS